MFIQRLNIHNQSVNFSGDGLYQAQVNLLNSFVIDAHSACLSNDDIEIITYPTNTSTCPMQIINNQNGTWTVNYIPNEIGLIQMDIFLQKKLINNHPFKVNIFDINQIHISNFKDGLVDQLVQFDIDTSKAGIGQLEIVVQDGDVPCEAIAHGSSRFHVTFLPQKCGLYKIDIRFNRLTIPGSPFSCSINDLSRVIVSNSQTHVHVGHSFSFDISNQSELFDVYILAPSGQSVPFERTQVNENHTRIDYILNEIGLHRVEIRSRENMDIYGSSFSLQTYDINRLIVSDIPRFIIFNQPVEFTIDASKAGEGELEVDVNNGLVPNQVKALGNSKFHFSFLPMINDPHLLSIKFNGQQLTGFPKECQVISSEDIQIHGPGLNQVLLNTQTWFTIDTLHGGSSDLQVMIFTPTKEQFNPSTLLTSAGLRVDWTPSEIGTYMIHVTLPGNPIPGSPFQVKCYDPKKVIVIPPTSDSSIRKPTKFLVDASKAGEGNLEISVNCSGHNIPNQINPIGNSHFEVQFTPQKAVIHQCNILFNGEPVPGSPFSVQVMEIPRVIAVGKGLGSIPIHLPTSFTIFTQNSLTGDLRCSIKGPDDHLISCIITKIDANRYEVTYRPDCVGEFHIEIFYNNIPIDNSPFISRSFDVTQIKISDFPSSTIVDSATYFLIDATDAGSGNLEIAISKDGKNIPNYVENEGGARFRIKFIPDQSCIHQVQIKFNGIEIPGSPFVCNVYSSEFTFEHYEYAPINKRKSFSIKPRLNSMFNANILVDIITPSGKQIPGKIEKIAMNSYLMGFIPKEIGSHEIRFYNNEERKMVVTKYTCQVYDINKIRVSDLPLAIAHQPYKFTINTAEAGHGVLSVRIKQNENRVSHEQTRISTDIYEISFIPETSDACHVQISFNGEYSSCILVIPVKIDYKHIRVSSIPSGIVGQPTIFTVDLAASNPISILVTESHSGRVVSHAITPNSNDKSHYEISFTPNTARQHTVSIFYDGKLVSTHHVDVCNVNKIRVSSITDGMIGIPSIFTVDTHGAGEGHLEVTIRDGRRTLPAELKSLQARKFDIAFIPEITGKHSVAIAFNGISIEGSPFMINIHDPSINNGNNLEEDDDDDDHEFLIGGQLEGTKVGEVAWLICETSLTDIYEDFNLYVIDPEGIIIKHTRIQDSAGRWRIEFEPTKAGIYQIQIDIDESKLILASMDILPLNYERNIYGERIVHPNVLNLISINSHNDDLKVLLRGSHGNEIPLEIERDSLELKIYFTLTENDYYQLSITDDDEEQLFDIHCVAEETDLFRNGGIEDIARLIIDHSKILTDDVNVIVKDPLAHTIPAAFYRNLTNDLVIEYIPIRTDIHEVFIRTQNNLLDLCPIRIMAFQSTNTFDPVLRVQVKEILEHTFQDIIDHNNKLEITITDPFERSIPFQRSKNERGELKISLSPIRVGTHWVRISNDENDSFALLPIFAFDDDYVPLSPVATPSSEEKILDNQTNSMTDSLPPLRELTTISETSEFLSSRTTSLSPEHLLSSIQESPANTFSILANEMTKSSVFNSQSSSDVQILDITDLVDPSVRTTSKFSFKDPGDKFDIKIYDAHGDEIRYKIEYLSDGRKSISYEATIVGPVEIHISKENQSIADSPFIVHAFDPSLVHVINFPKRIQVNITNNCMIDTTQAGKGSLKMTIKDPNDRSLPLNIQTQSNHHHAVQFTPTVSGLHTISILFNEIPIPKTPFQIYVENTEERGRSIYSKHDLFLLSQQQERLDLLSPQTISSRIAKSTENIPPKELLIAKSEEKHQANIEYIPFNESEIRRFQLLKEKFEFKQPIDIVFDPRRYPFQIYLQSSSPLVNTDIHFFIDLPHVAYVQIYISEMKIPLQLLQKNNNTYLLKFRPLIAGDYLIILKDINGQAIQGCPYIFPVYNPHGIQIEPFNHLQPITDCHFICHIDNIGKGKFFIMVYYQSKPIRISYKIQSLAKDRIRISFSPLKIGTYELYLFYRNFPINGTPVEITVYDIQGISLIAEHSEPVIVKTTVAYKVNTSQAGQGQLKAELIQPETSIIPCRCHVHELNNQEYLIEYIPNEPGRYQLRILFNNQLLQGKTIDTDVYSLLPLPLSSISNLHIQKILPNDTPKIGDDVCLQIMSEKSSIQGQISCNGISIPCQIQQTEDKHIWHLNFRPYIVGSYKIQLFHNELSIMNSPYVIQVKDIDEKNYLSGLTNTPCMIQIHTKSTSNSQIRAVVLLGGIVIPSTMTMMNDNLVRIHFTPQEPGFYFVNIYNGDQSIEGSPFLIRIQRPQVVEISGKCLDRLRLNDLGIFRIHCHGQRGDIQAKIFHLSVGDRYDKGQMISFQLLESYKQLIQFPSQIFLKSLTILLTARLRLTQERIRNLTLEEENGHAIISFQLFEIPTQIPTNEQILHVLRNLIEKQTLNLIDPNRHILHAVCGSLVVGSKGEPVNVKLFSLPNGDYMGEFTPKKIGQYRIDITFGNIPIEGSPFFTEIYDPLQVQISSLPKDILVGIENTFEINLEKAGNAPLEVIITSTSGINVPCKIDDTSKIRKIHFTPSETGVHYLNVKFGSDMIPGTPIQMMVNNPQIITAYGDGLHHALHEKLTTFMIDMKNMAGDLEVRIEGSNSMIKHTLEQINDSLFQVTYIPTEVGLVNISIKWNGKDIINSPFRAIVTNPERVRVVGGWQSILDSQNRMCVMINEEKKIRFDTSHAGPGSLKATIQGIDNDSIPLRIDQQNLFYTLNFTAKREGQYDLRITYADNLLPNMPIRLIASYVSSEHPKIAVTGRGLHEARVNEEAEFTIDTSKVSIDNTTKPIVRLTGPQSDVEVRIRQLEKRRHMFLCSYKPTLPGTYLLSIIYSEREIRGSPFKINVLANNHPASQVICSGDGLSMGIIGQEMQCLIDTRNASPGELIAYCQGSHRTAFCRLADHCDGTFTLFIKPEESERHALTIKYNGENVPGSPFTVKVSGPPDARKVRVSGPGIEHGILSTFQSHFICETKGAGAGQLTVKIRGPKGAFRVEMQREHLQDRTIICRYHPTESGDYVISVKWSGEHVYGSPFHTHIFESQEELDQFQHELV